MKPHNNQVTEQDDSFHFEVAKNQLNDTDKPAERYFDDKQLQVLSIELPPSIEEILGLSSTGHTESNNFNGDKTFWDGCIEETFEFEGMSPDWKYRSNFQKELILYRIKPREVDNLDINLILNHLALSKNNLFHKNLLEDENLMAIKSKDDFRIWSNKNPEVSRELLLNVLPIAGDNIWNIQNAENAQRNIKYVGLLNENYRELWRKWAKREDEIVVSQEEVSCKNAEIDRLKRHLQMAIKERDGHYDAVQQWKQRVNELSKKFLQHSKLSVKEVNQESSNKFSEFIRQGASQASMNNLPTFNGRRPGGNYLQVLKWRCENMTFSHHIKSLQPPDKFDGDPERFQNWATELIEFFQNRQRDFQKSSDRSLVIFAQSRLEGNATLMIQQISGSQEFMTLFDLLEFLYKTYGIKDMYSYYERKYDEMKWPSGPNQSQNLAIFRALMAPCKDILGWNNRTAISKFLRKVPQWTQREIANLRFDEDDYDEFLQELDDFYRRNYTSRHLLAESKSHAKGSDLKNTTGKGSYNDNHNSDKVEMQKDKLDENSKGYTKDNLREKDRREGRCYYCHQKGHLTALCQKKPTSGALKNVKESEISDKEEEFRMVQQFSSSSESSDSEN
ncbi:hypothetical protein GcM3_206022 [Golovinomyces cichoracearum]|uniref:CCHC-type domain-containing protein n=1 Tax=Golovinomyces cichoracearum TaxID=62708 RepID=A0A420HBS8_9PEZI|nr:hypothetical protein GcM3_206022 [Golovinomyces cichoracearum]